MEYQPPTDDQDSSDRMPGSSILEAIEECAPNPVQAIDAVGGGGLGSLAGAGAVRALETASRIGSSRLTEAMGGGETCEAPELAGGSSRLAGMEECAPEPAQAVDANITRPLDNLRGPVFLGEITDQRDR